MRSFLGLASYYRRFIKNFGKIAAPLIKVLENNRHFVCDDDPKNAFSELRTRLANAPILIYPDFSVSILLDSDASDKGIGAVLSQLGKNQLEHSIAYLSRTLENMSETTRLSLKNCMLLSKVSNTSDAIYTGDNLCYAQTMWQFNN